MHDDENKDDYSPQNISEADMLAELMGLTSQEAISENKLRKIFYYVELALSGSGD